MIRASIVGGAGYSAGELIRLLLHHPDIELTQICSRSAQGRFVHSVNPNLRKITAKKFSSPEDLQPCDVLFLCLPHGEAMHSLERYARLSPKIIDLSADFRLRQRSDYSKWYGIEHPCSDLLSDFVYGIPELNRSRIAAANLVACAGCNATAVILAALPLIRNFTVKSIVADVKVGSSEGGARSGEASHHPVRSGAVRSYRLTGHRHTAEIIQELDIESVYLSATSIEMVRGTVATCRIFTAEAIKDEKVLWRAFRETYRDEKFVRVVKDAKGIHRLPEPKHLAGSNYCDVGFEADPSGVCAVTVSAMDNLMKGAAGQAVQVCNIMHGFDETAALKFSGLFPA